MNHEVSGTNVPVQDADSLQVSESGNSLKKHVVCMLRIPCQVVFDIEAVNVLHQDVAAIQVRIQVVVEHSNDIRVEHIVQELNLADESVEQILSVVFGVRNVFLTNEMFIDLLIIQQDRLAACPLAQFSDHAIVAAPEKDDNIVSITGLLRHLCFPFLGLRDLTAFRL